MPLKLRQRINGRILEPIGMRLVRTRPVRREVASAPATLPHAPIEEAEGLRFRTNDWVYSAPVSQLVGRPIFGYGPQSWHPFVAAAAELVDDIDIPYERSRLKRFYETFTPVSVADACRLHDPGPLATVPAASLFEPWRLEPPPFDDPHAAEFPSGSPLFGPVSKPAAAAEWRRLKGRAKSILTYGYQPSLFPRGRIRVTVLRCSHEQRYLVGHGQHRAAVLAALGYDRIDVGIHQTDPPVVDEEEAPLWPHVRSGFLSADRAAAMLRRYFAPPASDPALQVAAATRGEMPSEAPVGP